MRRTPTALIGLGLLTLSACSGSADPSPPRSSSPPAPTSTAPTPSSSPTPTVPAMPDAAKAHTKAGAKAFAKYFSAVVNYAQQSGQTDAVTHLAIPGCVGCEAGVRAIETVYRAGGRIVGGDSTVSDATVELSWLGDDAVARVTVTMTNAVEVDDYPGTTKDVERASSTVRNALLLRQIDGAWRVAQIEAPR